jgi:hypothetical protein
MTTVEHGGVAATEPRHGGGRLRPGWPLVVLFVGFPAWWALGLAQIIFFVMGAVMAVYLVRQRDVLTPRGFSLWLLFLVWMFAGAFVLWAHAPGTVPGGGPARLAGFGVRALWYLTATVVMLYVLNTARHFSRQRIVLLLGYMFVVTTGFGLAAMIAPEFEFESLVELILPDRVVSSTFVRTLVHPSLASTSDFLGYEQPRPTAPFPYSNAWGNNVALFAPFFVYGWFGRDAGWRRKVAPFVLVGAIVPITYSLNRGLWIALAIAAVYASLRLAANGNVRGILVLGVAGVVGGLIFVSTPLYDTAQLRIDTPHSNDRRTSVASEVVGVTADGSPVVGYGTTRTMQGSFASLAGGGRPDCRQCAPPPLGTQGFMWRLVLTTGFVGTVLALGFLGMQFLRRSRGADPFDIVACSTLLIGGVCFFVYDSLGSALVTIFITVGLMARRSVRDQEATP